jgi:hypothetical protein
VALILGQLALNSNLRGLAQIIPEHGRAIMVLRRSLMADGGLPMQIGAVRHGSQV